MLDRADFETRVWLIASSGALINSALYLAGVIVAGLVLHDPWVWKLALASTGFAFLGYLAQLIGLGRPASHVVVSCSQVFGLLAGLILLVKD